MVLLYNVIKVTQVMMIKATIGPQCNTLHIPVIVLLGTGTNNKINREGLVCSVIS